MSWVLFALAIAGVVIGAFVVWRRLYQPLVSAENMLRALSKGQTPQTFLISGSGHGREIGLLAETLSARLNQLEAAMQEQSTSVQAIFGAMPDGLAVVDELRRVRMANPEFSRIFGANTSTPATTLLEAVSHASIDRLVADTIATGEARRESIQMSRGPSEGREMEVSVVPLPRNQPAVQGAVVLFRDVTQLRQVEEMRRDFVANVSHELRTPLSIFRGYLETLLDDPQQPPEELLRILEVMERHSDRLNALVEDVLSLARLESPDIQPDLIEVDLPALLESVAADWRPRMQQKELQLEVEISAELPVLWADEARLQEVVYNLVDNAVKYSRVGGRVTIGAASAGEQVRVSVSDEGIGIRESDLPRIFERFYRADKARSRDLGGTGLGLSIVKHIAQLHGGTVEAQSELGKGSTISVLLPVKGPPEQPELFDSNEESRS